MEHAERTLMQAGMSDKMIQAKKYFNVKFFRVRCGRAYYMPSRLYWRMRAVFAFYGKIIDPETKRPLFNKAAWAKANNLLKDILLGLYSNPPPGLALYHPKLTAEGLAAKDKLGLELLECDRGTGNIENSHRTNRDTFGTRHTGISSSDSLSTERHHRKNQRSPEKHHQGFPKVGHYDTWLIDQEHILVDKNHNTILYPTWSNPACD
jgi:hypothetical protein